MYGEQGRSEFWFGQMTMDIPAAKEWSSSATVKTAIVSISHPGEFRVILDPWFGGPGKGLIGVVGITPYNGGHIECTNPEYIDGDQCAWTVLDNGVVEARFRV